MKLKDIIEKYRQGRKFIAEDVWQFDLEELSKAKARFVKYLKVILITLKTFSAERINFQAISLSYFGLLSVIPFVAVMFAITDGFGLSDKLRDLLYTYFSDYEPVIDMVVGYANNILTTAQSGWVGLLSGLLFVWTILWLMHTVEKVFNNVWRVRKSRNVFKRFGLYILILALAPFIVILFFSGSIIYTNALKDIGLGVEYFQQISSIIAWVVFYILTTLILSVMYVGIPHAKVRYVNAFKASIAAGLAFTIMQYLYLGAQVFLTRWNVVYGAVAIIPLFMVWMTMGWFIILYGAELSYAFQNVNNYNLDYK